MCRLAVSILMLFALAFADAANGDERTSLAVLPGEVPNTARRIAAADKLAAQRQWAEAVE
jgi:hypothetical protein